jgi:hypothetical protein
MDKPFGTLEHEACRLLRWKSMFIEAASDPTVPPSNDQACWCAETQVCIGPDGGVVLAGDCGPGRSCYQGDPFAKLT